MIKPPTRVQSSLRAAAVLAILVLAAPALAGDPGPAEAFRSAVSKWAEADHRYIDAWWEANLDKDPALERVAVLCDLEGSEKRGVFVVEKDAAHRWEIPFPVDPGRTNVCGGAKPASVPRWETRPAKHIELRQNRRDGHSSVFFAIRAEQPCIVREEELTTGKGKKAVVIDHDKGKSKTLLVPEGMQPINR